MWVTNTLPHLFDFAYGIYPTQTFFNALELLVFHFMALDFVLELENPSLH